MRSYLLNNFEIQKYYQKEPQFNCVYCVLPKIKNETYITNLDEYESTGTHQIALQVNAENIAYLDNIGVEHTPNEISTFTGSKDTTKNIYSL